MKTKFIIGILFLLPALALAADPPATHGMLVFGGKKIYVSHLPMFMRPHDYQMIYEVTFDAEGTAKYLKDRKTHRGYYTLAPQKFVLPAMVANPKPFKAILFRDHFERKGKELTPVTVTLKAKIVFEKFKPDAKAPESASYLVFGDNDEKYAAHVITTPPDFDQILEVKGRSAEIVTTPNSTEALKEGGKVGELTVTKEIYLEKGELAEGH